MTRLSSAWFWFADKIARSCGGCTCSFCCAARTMTPSAWHHALASHRAAMHMAHDGQLDNRRWPAGLCAGADVTSSSQLNMMFSLRKLCEQVIHLQSVCADCLCADGPDSHCQPDPQAGCAHFAEAIYWQASQPGSSIAQNLISVAGAAAISACA